MGCRLTQGPSGTGPVIFFTHLLALPSRGRRTVPHVTSPRAVFEKSNDAADEATLGLVSHVVLPTFLPLVAWFPPLPFDPIVFPSHFQDSSGLISNTCPSFADNVDGSRPKLPSAIYLKPQSSAWCGSPHFRSVLFCGLATITLGILSLIFPWKYPGSSIRRPFGPVIAIAVDPVLQCSFVRMDLPFFDPAGNDPPRWDDDLGTISPGTV